MGGHQGVCMIGSLVNIGDRVSLVWLEMVMVDWMKRVDNIDRA